MERVKKTTKKNTTDTTRGTNWDKVLPSSAVRSREPHMGALTHSRLQPNHLNQLPNLRIYSSLLPGGSWSGVEGQETVAVRWRFHWVTS